MSSGNRNQQQQQTPKPQQPKPQQPQQPKPQPQQPKQQPQQPKPQPQQPKQQPPPKQPKQQAPTKQPTTESTTKPTTESAKPKDKKKIGKIIGICVGVIIACVIIGGLIYWFFFRKKHIPPPTEPPKEQLTKIFPKTDFEDFNEWLMTSKAGDKIDVLIEKCVDNKYNAQDAQGQKGLCPSIKTLILGNKASFEGYTVPTASSSETSKCLCNTTTDSNIQCSICTNSDAKLHFVDSSDCQYGKKYYNSKQCIWTVQKYADNQYVIYNNYLPPNFTHKIYLQYMDLKLNSQSTNRCNLQNFSQNFFSKLNGNGADSKYKINKNVPIGVPSFNDTCTITPGETCTNCVQYNNTKHLVLSNFNLCPIKFMQQTTHSKIVNKNNLDDNTYIPEDDDENTDEPDQMVEHISYTKDVTGGSSILNGECTWNIVPNDNSSVSSKIIPNNVNDATEENLEFFIQNNFKTTFHQIITIRYTGSKKVINAKGDSITEGNDNKDPNKNIQTILQKDPTKLIVIQHHYGTNRKYNILKLIENIPVSGQNNMFKFKIIVEVEDYNYPVKLQSIAYIADKSNGIYVRQINPLYADGILNPVTKSNMSIESIFPPGQSLPQIYNGPIKSNVWITNVIDGEQQTSYRNKYLSAKAVTGDDMNPDVNIVKINPYQDSQAQDSEAQDSQAQDSEAQDSEAQDSQAQDSEAEPKKLSGNELWFFKIIKSPDNTEMPLDNSDVN